MPTMTVSWYDIFYPSAHLRISWYQISLVSWMSLMTWSPSQTGLAPSSLLWIPYVPLVPKVNIYSCPDLPTPALQPYRQKRALSSPKSQILPIKGLVNYCSMVSNLSIRRRATILMHIVSLVHRYLDSDNSGTHADCVTVRDKLWKDSLCSLCLTE